MSTTYVYLVEFFISHYDGSSHQGIFSSLDKSVQACQDMIQEYGETSVENPFKSGGYVIYEFEMDKFGRKETPFIYNDKGRKLTKKEIQVNS